MNLKESIKNIILLLIVVILLASPLIFIKDGSFEGADGQAGDAITEINPDYEPWISPFIEPASKEIESLLFSLQAAIGGAVIGYFYGFVRCKRKLANS